MNKPIKSSRRKLLTVLGISAAIPSQWAQPVVNSVLLPTHASTSCEMLPLTLDILTDSFGSEVSLTLTDLTDDVILAQVATSELLSDTQSNIFTGVGCADHCYELVINDSFGDGICCTFDLGEYTLALGEEVVTGGDYGSGETVFVGQCNSR